MDTKNLISKILWVTIFATAMAFVESAVVVYLRVIYYPEGFGFPLKFIFDKTLTIELFREIATIIMLLSVAVMTGKKFRERFAYFLIAWGLWDIFYYVWLKVLINWPSSIFEWDILFLIPLPWIGPVIAPVSIALLMVIAGILIVYSLYKGLVLKPPLTSYLLASVGAAVILYSFMYDIDATIRQHTPLPYPYEFLIIGDILFVAAFVTLYLKELKITGED